MVPGFNGRALWWWRVGQARRQESQDVEIHKLIDEDNVELDAQCAASGSGRAGLDEPRASYVLLLPFACGVGVDLADLNNRCKPGAAQTGSALTFDGQCRMERRETLITERCGATCIRRARAAWQCCVCDDRVWLLRHWDMGTWPREGVADIVESR